jgi:hypothetical protein
VIDALFEHWAAFVAWNESLKRKARTRMRTVDDWDAILSGIETDNSAGIFSYAAHLEAAREELTGRDWECLAYERQKLDQHRVYMLIAIVNSEPLSDVDRERLPADLACLYALSRLPNDRFAAAVDGGFVGPSLRAVDVPRLRLFA